MLLNKHNLNVARVASTEESRYSMCAIECSDKGTVATDGHRLAHVTPAPGNDCNFPAVAGFTPTGVTSPFLLSAKTALEVARAIPKKNKNTIPILEHANVAVTDTEVSLVVTDLEKPRVFTERKPEGRFPNWQAVIPKREDYKLTFGIRAKYLMDAAKLAMDFAPDAAGIRISIKDANSAILIEVKNSDTEQTLTQVVMPVRL